MTMRTQYIASSLEDIAEHFDWLAEKAQERKLSSTITARVRIKLESVEETWIEAAKFMREVKLEMPAKEDEE